MKRYDKIDDTGSGYSDMREAPTGEWVRHEDIMPFIAEVIAYEPVEKDTQKFTEWLRGLI